MYKKKNIYNEITENRNLIIYYDKKNNEIIYHDNKNKEPLYIQYCPFNNETKNYLSAYVIKDIRSSTFIGIKKAGSLTKEKYFSNFNDAFIFISDLNISRYQFEFYKNTITTYYYADLAIKYLTLAKNNGYEADDIAEYLGLSYASLGQTYESISAFTEALLVRESDFLLLSIAEQYYKANETGAAQQYLFRIINNSSNDEIILKSRLLLGNIYIDIDELDNAKEQFDLVLQKDDNSADAHYGLGLIYEKQENLVSARAEWRKARKIQPNHAGAVKKLSE